MYDPILGVVRRCRECREVWPDDSAFYERRGYASCNACRSDRANGRAIPHRAATHGSTPDLENKRRLDTERKAALRRDPVFGDVLRAKQAAASVRYYARNRTVCLERRRQKYAAQLDRPVREGFGRPRIAA